MQCDRIQKTFDLVNNGLVVKDVAEWRESGDDHRPDIGVYPTDEQAAAAYTPDKKSKTKVDQSRVPYRASVAWAWLTCFGELKHDPNLSGYSFDDDDATLLRDTAKAITARAQNIKYMAELMYRQHRTHVFSFYGLKSRVRLLRWDRNGVLFSKPIDLLQHPERFLNFFYRMAAMSRMELGYDTTATLADTKEIEMLRLFPTQNQHARKMLDEATTNLKEYPIYKVCVTVIRLLSVRAEFIVV